MINSGRHKVSSYLFPTLFVIFIEHLRVKVSARYLLKAEIIGNHPKTLENTRNYQNTPKTTRNQLKSPEAIDIFFG